MDSSRLSSSKQSLFQEDSESVLSGHATRSQEWQTARPSQPHLMSILLGQETPPRLSENDYTSLLSSKRQFLNEVIQGNHVLKLKKDGPLEWVYEERRKMQPILPFLYLAPWGAVKDQQALRADGITMLLGIRNSAEPSSKFMNPTKIAADLKIASEMIDLASSTDFISGFRRASASINVHLREIRMLERPNVLRDSAGVLLTEGNYAIGKILIFCETGNERSAAFVAAYLMEMYGISFLEAIYFILGTRFCAGFDDTTKHILEAYESVLRAQFDVMLATESMTESKLLNVPNDTRSRSQSGTTSPSSSIGGKKRHFDDVDDADEMSEAVQTLSVDHERFTGRPGFAPHLPT